MTKPARRHMPAWKQGHSVTRRDGTDVKTRAMWHVPGIMELSFPRTFAPESENDVELSLPNTNYQ